MNFEGAIGEMDLVQRLVELGREHFTGAIRFEQDGIIKIVYFKGGDVLSASTNDRKDAVDEILLRAGKVGREHVKQALAKREESQTLGDALLNLGFITRKELTWARRVQVIGILRSVRAWTSGNYAIVADYLPKREEGTLFPLQQIIVEFIVTEQDRQTFDRAMDGGNAVFHKSADFDAAFEKLGLNEEAAEITSQIDGRKNAAEIASATGKEAFNVYKLLEALRLLGFINKGEVKDELSFESAGVADAADAWTTEAIPDSEPLPEPPPAAPTPSIEEPQMQFEDSPQVPFALKLDKVPENPLPTPFPPEPQWGFDEAQIETAQRATASPAPTIPSRPLTPRRTISRPAPKPKRSGGVLFALIVLLLIAGIGVGGWIWWQGRSVRTVPVAVSRPAKHPIIQPTPVTATTTATTNVNAGAVAAVITRPAAVPQTTSAAPAAVPPPRPQPKPVNVTSAPRLEQSASGQSTITNAPAAPPASPANQDRYAMMARQYAQNPSGNYTVQFELVCQSSSLAKAVEGGGSNVWFVPINYRGQSCYRVFWGHFETREAATKAAVGIPKSLRSSAPVVVSVPKS